MSGNTTGVLFRVTTWGESHGPALGTVIDGCPPRIELTEADIQAELERRKPGQAEGSSPRKEGDRVEILSGVFEGKTTGTPISLIIWNRDVRSRDYEALRNVFRPGHGDYTYEQKYGIRDHRGGGRASGRETASRVAAGAIARKLLAREGIMVSAYTLALGGVKAEAGIVAEAGRNRFNCPDPVGATKMEAALKKAQKEGDTLGGIVEIIVQGCPAGLGAHVFDKLDADLAKSLMGIGTVKGVEIGAGFAAAGMTGSQCNDPLLPSGFAANNSGGILAGIASGQDLVIRAACKPIPSISREQDTVDINGKPVKLAVGGRHDVSVIPRILPVCEAMVCLVLVDHLLRQRAIERSSAE
ncbi:MAG TPA: chorismate synthase [Syntrophus sp. (in: bacteria)]|nr:chorismate synthase [Syntrophus sp. (in: bacteria)]